MFYRLGHWTYRRRYLVIAAWIIVLLVAAPFLPRVQSVLSGGGFANGTTDSDRALSLLQSDLHYYPSAVTIIFSDPTLRVDAPAFRQDMSAALDRLKGLPHLARIETYDNTTQGAGAPSSFSAPGGAGSMISPDHHSTYAVLDFTTALEKTQTELPALRARLHTTRLRAIVTGDPPVYDDMVRISIDDLSQVERYTFPVALVLLVLVFGTLVAAGVPLIIGGVSVAATLAVLYVLGRITPMSIFSLNTSTLIGLGVGIDYALLIVSRYREELAHRSIEDAVATTVAHAGRAVLFSGFTVMLGLGGLLMFKAIALRSMGIGGAVVVAVAVLAALTLVPAVLSVLGQRVDRLAVLPRRPGGGHFWSALARVVMRRPWPFIAGTLVIILFIASPVRALQLNIPDATILPKSVPSRQGFDILQNTFKVNQDSPTLPVVYAPNSQLILQPRYLGALYDYVGRIKRDPAVLAVQSIVSFDPGLTRADYLALAAHLADPAVARAVGPLVGTHASLVVVYPRRGLSKARGEALVKAIRAIPLGGGLRVVVGGYTAGEMDYIGALYSDFPKAVLFVIGSTFLVLLLLFRSVVLPLKAVIMNILSLLGSYGALVFIFQQGHFASVLNFSATGYVDEITPIVMFCTLFGLSMDYEVFLLTRIREEYLRTGDNEHAVQQGLARTGRIITSAALILVVVAGSFAFTNLVLVKAVGLGLALAIVIDATLIRSLLVPATMRVLGRWNWWAPRWLDRPLDAVERLIGSPVERDEEARPAPSKLPAARHEQLVS